MRKETPTRHADASLGARDRILLGECEVDLSVGTIRRRGGQAVRVEPKALAVLDLLLQRRGRLVTRDELLERVWSGRYVTDHVLSRSVSLLRKALADDSGSPHYIETIPTRGYRLIEPPVAAREVGPRTVSHARPAPPRGQLGSLILASLALITAVSVALLVPLFAPAASPPRVLPASVGLGSEVDPAISTDGERLAFSWTRGDGGVDLYLTRVGRALPSRLTSSPGRETNPAWRPGSEEVAFSRSSGGRAALHLLSLRDGSERLLTPVLAADVADLAWSPDGRYLFYPDRSRPSAPSAVARFDLLTGRRRWVTFPEPGSFGDRDLALSPDGERLAFARAVLPGIEDLYLARVGERTVRRLTHDGASINGMAWIGRTDEILFSSTRDEASRLWRISAKGGAPRPVEAAGESAFDPSYSEAGDRLVFERRSFASDVWTLSLRPEDRFRRARVSPSTRWDASPAIAPNGRAVAFVSVRGGSSEIWIGRPGTPAGARRVSRARRVIGRPAWAPDHRRLAVAILREGQADIAVIDTATGEEKLEIRSATHEVCPAFLPDGERLLYSSFGARRWDVWSVSTLDGRKQLLVEDALCPRPSPDGATIFFTRPGRPGIWRSPVGGGRSVSVPATAEVLPWDDWDVGPGMIVTRPVARFPRARSSVVILSHPGPNRLLPLPLDPAPFAGLGISLARDGRTLAFAEASAEDSDLMLLEPLR
ncbi:MAG TPA: winged helix-turn-helix domain-containing protein [Thermoanaerobaculia bacterium]|nr:winged helix-turn-helix domain-containing protein [Thermoanaerobaculia bacterium]